MLAKLDRSMAANVLKIASHFYHLVRGINLQLCNYHTSKQIQFMFRTLLQIFKINIIQNIINVATFVSKMQKMFCIVHFKTANLQNIMSPLQSFSRYETVTTLLEAIACRSYLPFLASLNNILFESLFLPPVKELFHLKGYRRKESSLLTQMPYFRNKLKAQNIYTENMFNISFCRTFKIPFQSIYSYHRFIVISVME